MKKINKNIVILLITLVLLIVLDCFVTKTDNYYGYFMIPLGIVGGYIVSVFIHEFGHFVFGLISGYKFVSFSVLGVTLMRKNAKFKVIYQGSMGLIAGQCLMSPPKTRKFILYNLGGLIFSYLFSIVLVYYIFKVENIFINQFLFGIFVLNTMLAIMNSLYDKNGINDICNVIRGVKNKEFLEGFFYQLDVVSKLSNGLKLGNSKFKPSDNSGHIYSNVTIWRLKYFEAFEKKDDEKLQHYYKLLKRNIDRVGMYVLKMPIMFVILFHEFALNNNVEAVKRSLLKFSKKDILKLEKYDVEYKLYLFYKNSILGDEEPVSGFWELLNGEQGYDTLTELNDKMNKLLKRKYLNYKGANGDE